MVFTYTNTWFVFVRTWWLVHCWLVGGLVGWLVGWLIGFSFWFCWWGIATSCLWGPFCCRKQRTCGHFQQEITTEACMISWFLAWEHDHAMTYLWVLPEKLASRTRDPLSKKTCRVTIGHAILLEIIWFICLYLLSWWFFTFYHSQATIFHHHLGRYLVTFSRHFFQQIQVCLRTFLDPVGSKGRFVPIKILAPRITLLAIGYYIGASAKLVLSHRISLGALVTTINATFFAFFFFGFLGTS